MSKHYLAPLIIAVGITSCSEIGDKLRGDGKTANISSVDEHSDSASPPVSVAGSFLHCNIPSFQTEKDVSKLIYDCGLKRDEEFIVLPADSRINFQMLSQDKEVVLDNIEHTVPAPGTFRFAVKLDLKNPLISVQTFNYLHLKLTSLTTNYRKVALNSIWALR